MKIHDNTVLITGGSSGIGLALAKSLLELDNEVIICGRREDLLIGAQNKYPGLHIRVCDVSNAEDRKSLFTWVTENFSGLNLLINNAGIQREINFKNGLNALNGENEILIDLESPIHLSALFIPHLEKMKDPAIINVSSALGIIPMAVFPVYCASKAGLHVFTQCLRYQLIKTGIKVFEVLPPMVDTELNKEYRDKIGSNDNGIKPEKCIEAIIKGIKTDQYEIMSPMLENLETATKKDFEHLFDRMNSQWK
jgi:uncharacterized oxidoreductase